MTEPTPDPELSVAERVRRANTVQRDKPKRKKAPAKKRREDPKLSPWNAKMSARIGAKELQFLCFQLRHLIEAGVPITEAWRHAALSTNHPLLRPVCKMVSKDLTEGLTLEQALNKHPGLLSPFFRKMIIAGHRSGNLVTSLGDLQRHFSWMMNIKGDVIRAFSYLIICLLLCRLILAMFMFFLTGIIQAQERGATVGLPEDPLMLAVSLLWRVYWPVVASIAFAYACAVITTQVRRIRFAVDVIFISIPIVGGFVRNAVVANFCRMYGKLQSSGMMPSQTYRFAAESMGNLALCKQMLVWQHFVDHGEPVAEALRRAKVLPKDALGLLEIGDSVSSTEGLMTRLADYMSDNLRVQVRTFTRIAYLFTPFLLLIVIVIVAVAIRASSMDIPLPADLILIWLIFYILYLL